jgi:hypothetical protein
VVNISDTDGLNARLLCIMVSIKAICIKKLRQVSSGDTDVVSFKTETLEQAGINLRTAERYEELTGGRES